MCLHAIYQLESHCLFNHSDTAFILLTAFMTTFLFPELVYLTRSRFDSRWIALLGGGCIKYSSTISPSDLSATQSTFSGISGARARGIVNNILDVLPSDAGLENDIRRLCISPRYSWCFLFSFLILITHFRLLHCLLLFLPLVGHSFYLLPRASLSFWPLLSSPRNPFFTRFTVPGNPLTNHNQSICFPDR